MDPLRVVGALAVSLGIPIFANVYPGSASTAPAAVSAPAPVSVPETSASVTATGSETIPTSPSISFEKIMVRLAADADSVDRVWQAYKSDCGVKVLKDYDFGREWFALLDHAAHATIDNLGCVPLRRKILQEGGAVRQDLRSARAEAHRARVDQGTETGLLRWHGLQWR